MRHAAGELADRLHLLRLAQLFLEMPALRDVLRHADEAIDRALGVAHRRRAIPHPAHRAVGLLHAVFHRPAGPRQDRGLPGLHRRAVLGHDRARPRLRGGVEALAGASPHLGVGRADVEHLGLVRARDPEDLVDVFRELAKPFLARAERLLLAPEQGAVVGVFQGRRQLVQVAGALHQIVRRAAPERAHRHRLVPLPGHHHHGHVHQAPRLEQAHHLHRVEPAQAVVEEQDVGRRPRAGQAREHVLAVRHHVDVDVGRVPREVAPHDLDVGRVVLRVKHAQGPGAPRQPRAERPARRLQHHGQLQQMVAALHQVVVRPGLQGRHRAALVARAGQHHHRERNVPLPHADHKLDARSVRQIQVHQREIEILPARAEPRPRVRERAHVGEHMLRGDARQLVAGQLHVHLVVLEVKYAHGDQAGDSLTIVQ